jgi:hypothetical protein
MSPKDPHKTALILVCFLLLHSIQDAYRFGDIVDNNGSLCTSIVHGGKRMEAFLTRRIPNLEFDGSIVQVALLS